MSARDEHIAYLFTAEVQFRLASAVRIATTQNAQPLDLPMVWTHGDQTVKYEDIALRSDQADGAAFFLQRSATFLMAVAVKDAIKATIADPKHSTDLSLRAAFEISRLVRNAFAHAPFAPTWSIDPDCRDQVFEVPGVIRLDTRGLQGVAFDWRHYGGPLALLKLCRHARMELLKDIPSSGKEVPSPTANIRQIGDLMLKAVAELPPGCVPIDADAGADGRIPLGGGYFVAAPPGATDGA